MGQSLLQMALLGLSPSGQSTWLLHQPQDIVCWSPATQALLSCTFFPKTTDVSCLATDIYLFCSFILSCFLGSFIFQIFKLMFNVSNTFTF